MAGEPDTNGTQPTDQPSEPTSVGSTLTTKQVETMVDDLMAKRTGKKVTRWPDWKFQLWESWAKVKHLAGIHTFIPTELWDHERGTVWFAGECCWICDERAYP